MKFTPSKNSIAICIAAALGVAAIITILLLKSWSATAQVKPQKHSIALTHADFIELVRGTEADKTMDVLDTLEQHWHRKYIPMMIESMNYTSSSLVRYSLDKLLFEKTGYMHADDTNDWYHWLWNQPESIAEDYAEFKAKLYQQIDPLFEEYFTDRQTSARIRLDEIRWGGVVQDGIPPLRDPEMLHANEQTYLADDNIVFGVKIKGEARAYPKRILAWHEMFTDTFGEGDSAEPIAGVYCTLCGTVIIYKTRHKGVDHKIGTSGFLYRSNKLMYDQATSSLWSTVRGEPVVGPLVDKGIALEHLSVVTTTWGEWKRRHPDTSVLSLNTGHRRDYGEGVAYNDYFSTDRLMFNTPFGDSRLKNKQEVLALRFQGAPNKQLAIDTDFLRQNPVFYERVGKQKFVVLTDSSGANRVYEPAGVQFVKYDQDKTLTDTNGQTWSLTEEALINSMGKRLERLPYHRAFWFGWHAAFPDTRLIN